MVTANMAATSHTKWRLNLTQKYINNNFNSFLVQFSLETPTITRTSQTTALKVHVHPITDDLDLFVRRSPKVTRKESHMFRPQKFSKIQA